MKVTKSHIHVCTRFEADLLNHVQNFPQNMVKHAYFPTFRNSLKLEKNSRGPIFGVKVTRPHIHVHTRFEADLVNNAQKFSLKLQIIRRQTDGQTDVAP